MGVQARELHRLAGARSSPTARSPRRASVDIDDGERCARDLDGGQRRRRRRLPGRRRRSGNITTLGRGGSDTSAVALAAALKADECQIYTDVDGVYTTDPRVVPEARRLDKITFEEMLEMASLGSKVLQIRSVEFAGKYKRASCACCPVVRRTCRRATSRAR
ncbi:MAG: hypothetical protein MZV49_04635 [Rhodopseudomonas palustris]|nr:hypothetical protein [Rhodopseudomonas palustris]